MAIEVSATPRAGEGRGASRRLRHAGRVPGILYGAGKPAQSIELDHKDLYQNLRQEAFHASILTLLVDGEKQQVLLRDVQMHPWEQRVLHVDFQRVARDRKIHIKVPLHFINADVAPGVKTGGGVVNHVMTEVEISCLPDDLPEFINVDLSELNVGQSVRLSSLVFPKGVESVQLRAKEDKVVVSITIVKEIVEEVPVVEAAAVPTVEGAEAAPGAVPGAAPAPGAAAPAAAAPGAAPAAAKPEEKKERREERKGDRR